MGPVAELGSRIKGHAYLLEALPGPLFKEKP